MTTTVAVIGVGVAGRARVRALQGHPRAQLVAVHRGRFAADAGVPVVDADEVLKVAELVVVASPSETHETWVEAALRGGRHVIVEYPLARTGAAARRLLTLAGKVGRVLHVEHIGRLAPPTVWLAAKVDSEGWTHASMTFESPGAPWPDGATHAWQCESRLHRLTQVLGWPATLDVSRADGARIEATARWADGRSAALRLLRGGGGERGLDFVVDTVHGERRITGRGATEDGVPVQLPERALFRADLDVTLDRIAGTSNSYVSDEVMAAILDLTEVLGLGPGERSVKPA